MFPRKWRSRLSDKDREAVDKKTSSIYQVFKEHLCLFGKYKASSASAHEFGQQNNETTDNASDIFSKIYETLNKTIDQENDFVEAGCTSKESYQDLPSLSAIMSVQVYEVYAKFITGLSSVIALSTNTADHDSLITFDEASYSRQLVINKQSLRIQHQNPNPESKTNQLHKDSLLIPVSKSGDIKSFLKSLSVIVLTPEQQTILKGNSRQLIFGYAGTGKTILLQAKALELLSQGKSVTVFTGGSFKIQYKKIFDDYNYTRYRIRDWGLFVNDVMRKSSLTFICKKASCTNATNIKNFKDKLLKICQTLINEGISPFGDERELSLQSLQLVHFEHLYVYLQNAILDNHQIIVDDFDIVFSNNHDNPSENRCLIFLALLVILQMSTFDCISWIALHSSLFYNSKYGNALQSIAESCGFANMNLTKIMRCSNSVFSASYPTRDLATGLLLFPDDPVRHGEGASIGHKVQGVPPIGYKQHFATSKDAWEALSQKLPDLIIQTLGENLQIPDNFVGIIFTLNSSLAVNNWNMAMISHLLIFYFSKKNINISAFIERSMSVSERLHVISHKGRFPISNNQILINRSHLIASFEWPVVFHVIIGSKADISEKTKSIFENFVHQARSRAITTFVELFYTFDKETEWIDPYNNMVKNAQAETVHVELIKHRLKFFVESVSMDNIAKFFFDFFHNLINDDCIRAENKSKTEEHNSSIITTNLQKLLKMLDAPFVVLSDEKTNLCIENVVEGMKLNYDSLSVSRAGIECLYNFCKDDRTVTIHKALLSQIVDICLTVIEKHIECPQLHNVVWLILYDDCIFQSEACDAYRFCSVAFESMLRNDNSLIIRMTVWFISNLVAKIPPEMTNILGTNKNYMRFLLGLVEQNGAVQHQWHLQNVIEINNPTMSPDLTLIFTLEALWNLTDGSPPICQCLVSENGLEVVFKVLDVFKDHKIEKNVLGILGNVTEVQELKSKILSHSTYLSTIKRLLQSSKFKVSFLAAGILANLCIDQDWSACSPTKDECLYALEESIRSWIPPSTAMIGIRSFKPYFSLLINDDMPAVQLWSVWTIHHLIQTNVERYKGMFVEEDGLGALEHIMVSSADKQIIQESFDILKLLA